MIMSNITFSFKLSQRRLDFSLLDRAKNEFFSSELPAGFRSLRKNVEL